MRARILVPLIFLGGGLLVSLQTGCAPTITNIETVSFAKQSGYEEIHRCDSPCRIYSDPRLGCNSFEMTTESGGSHFWVVESQPVYAEKLDEQEYSRLLSSVDGDGAVDIRYWQFGDSGWGFGGTGGPVCRLSDRAFVEEAISVLQENGFTNGYNGVSVLTYDADRAAVVLSVVKRGGSVVYLVKKDGVVVELARRTWSTATTLGRTVAMVFGGSLCDPQEVEIHATFLNVEDGVVLAIENHSVGKGSGNVCHRMNSALELLVFDGAGSRVAQRSYAQRTSPNFGVFSGGSYVWAYDWRLGEAQRVVGVRLRDLREMEIENSANVVALLSIGALLQQGPVIYLDRLD